MAYPRNEKLRKDVLRLSREGHNVTKIAAELDLPRATISSMRQRLRAGGELPATKRPRRTPTRMATHYREVLGVKRGSMTVILESLDLNTVEWLYSKVPPGGTLADVIGGIIREVRSST